MEPKIAADFYELKPGATYMVRVDPWAGNEAYFDAFAEMVAQNSGITLHLIYAPKGSIEILPNNEG